MGKSSGICRFEEYIKGETKEAKIVQDANTLEALIEAKEYVQQGIKIMKKWFKGKEFKGKEFKGKTGKKIFDALKRENIYWWKE